MQPRVTAQGRLDAALPSGSSGPLPILLIAGAITDRLHSQERAQSAKIILPLS